MLLQPIVWRGIYTHGLNRDDITYEIEGFAKNHDCDCFGCDYHKISNLDVLTHLHVDDTRDVFVSLSCSNLLENVSVEKFNSFLDSIRGMYIPSSSSRFYDPYIKIQDRKNQKYYICGYNIGAIKEAMDKCCTARYMMTLPSEDFRIYVHMSGMLGEVSSQSEKYRQKARKAISLIEDTVLQYLYRPDGNLYKKAMDRFKYNVLC